MAQIALQLTQKNDLPKQFMTSASALVFALIVVVSLGFAIDTYNPWFINNLQDATDTIAMSAATALCQGGDPETAAIQALTLNPAVYSLQNVNITIANPPPTGANYAGNSNYVYIELSGQKSTYFNQLMNGQPSEIATISVTSCS